MSPAAGPAIASTQPRPPSQLGSILRNYRFPLFILTGVVSGAIIGLIFGEKATVIKPFGTLFINMMFTRVVPLVFFSISSAVAGMSSATRLGKISGSMLGIFAVTGVIASIVMIVMIAALWITEAAEGVQVEMTQPKDVEEVGSIGEQLVSTFVVDDFSAILFAAFGRDFFTPGNILIGIAVALLAGMVMAGIPSGGFIGELMIITLYGFPAAALPIIQIIGTVIDPPATTVNAVGDQASSMMVARVLDGKDWMDRPDGAQTSSEQTDDPRSSDTPAEAAAPEST